MPANNTEIEKRLWDAADELRANSRLRPSEYYLPVLGLIFLRYADHKFVQADREIQAERVAAAGRRQRPITEDDYRARGVLYLPDTRAGEFSPRRKVLVVLADKIRALALPADISEVMGAVEDLLDESVEAKEYFIRETGVIWDLSKVDFEALKRQFERGRKRTEAEKLRGTLNVKLQRMVRLNRSRMDYLEEFQRIIDEYNAGSRNVEEFFDALVEFARRLNEEDQRAIAEELTEEELAVFDILTRPALKLTTKEKREVKQVAQDLLETLKREKLVLDWRKRQQSRAAVRVLIEELIWQLPKRFTEEICRQKSAQIYQHVYDNYWGPERSIYAMAA